ncbi:MAG: FtsX-like permease family protein [Firmicutes bacterium]|jgi:putative ABC transport system permease protein|nr:FtsX-like permease family protein [Bacillota bacterium]
MDFNLIPTLKMAVGSILKNKMRSFLTILGIIIGVSAVITLVSVGEGSARQVTQRIESLGSNLITVFIRGRGAVNSISYDEAMEFMDIPGVEGVAPVQSSTSTVKYGNKTFDDASLDLSNSHYINVLNFNLDYGRFLLESDITYRQKVAVIGKEVVDELFPFQNPLGEKITINGQKFVVVGVLQEKGTSMRGSSDNKVVIPITTGQRLLGSTEIRTVYLTASSSEVVDTVISQLQSRLVKKFKSEDNFNIFSQTEMLSTVSEVTGTMTAMLGGIAGISLIVGGIGIMNIMLVSVTERTREIGIRKAIGAKKSDILIQFLIESVVLSGMGGLLGLITGIAGSGMISGLVGFETVISPRILIIAIAFSVFVGVFFGIYPANKAARLNPVDALRYE